jgi:hypothetical protein
VNPHEVNVVRITDAAVVQTFSLRPHATASDTGLKASASSSFLADESKILRKGWLFHQGQSDPRGFIRKKCFAAMPHPFMFLIHMSFCRGQHSQDVEATVLHSSIGQADSWKR